MSSFPLTKPSCPKSPTGYNVCIENDTELNQEYHFGVLPDSLGISIRQSVIVPRNTSICYRVIAPLGDLIISLVTDPLDNQILRHAGALTCSVHITTRTIVSLSDDELLTGIFTTLDCSPCPCPCEFTCASEKKACERIIGTELGLGIARELTKLCTETTPYELKATKTTSCCDDAPCDKRGYNVCIENTHDEDILFNFFYADPAISINQPAVQSVLVRAGDTICYRLNISPGIVVGIDMDVDDVILTTTHIACSTYLKAILGENGILSVASDCTPCPNRCSEKNGCKPH